MQVLFGAKLLEEVTVPPPLPAPPNCRNGFWVTLSFLCSMTDPFVCQASYRRVSKTGEQILRCRRPQVHLKIDKARYKEAYSTSFSRFCRRFESGGEQCTIQRKINNLDLRNKVMTKKPSWEGQHKNNKKTKNVKSQHMSSRWRTLQRQLSWASGAQCHICMCVCVCMCCCVFWNVIYFSVHPMCQCHVQSHTSEDRTDEQESCMSRFGCCLRVCAVVSISNDMTGASFYFFFFWGGGGGPEMLT